MSGFIDGFPVFALVTVVVLMVVSLLRVWWGPTVYDRLIAVALIMAKGVTVIALFGFALGRPELFLDMAIAYALLAFLLPLAMGKYFEGTGHR